MRVPSDQAIRSRAGQELNTSFALDAGAGTGKTTVLVSRILEAVRTGKSDLEHIVAITFTEKAAGELKVRLRFELEQALQQSHGDEETRFRQAIADIERAQVTTIHSFCAALLHERPVEAGVKPDFEVLDELGADLLIDKVWAEWLAGELDHGTPVLGEILHAGIKLDALFPPAKYLLDHRDLLDLAPAPAPENADEVMRRLEAAIKQLTELQKNCKEPADRGSQAIDTLRAELAECSALEGIKRRDTLLTRFKIQTRVGVQRNWTPKEALDTTREILNELQGTVEQFAAVVAHNRTVQVIQWLRRFVERFEDAKSESGCLDFFDLLYRCRNLLKDNQEVRGYFQRRFDFILVDEFQDTDPLQIEILFFLAEQTPQANRWSETKLRPGKLFLVGDPKQSIYSFRGADIEAYHEAKEVLARQGEPLPLSFNFRSRPPVIHWINGLFSKLIHRPPDGHYQPTYQPIVGLRDGDQGVSVLALPLAPQIPLGNGKAGDFRLAEARTVAAFLKKIVADAWSVSDPRSGEQRALRYGDIAILFRTKEAIDRYEEEFRDFDIPYRVAGGRRYYSRLEMNALLALLSAIDNPKDGVALVAALRSPFFGVSDEEMFLHAQEGHALDYTTGETESGAISKSKRMKPGPLRAAFRLLKEFHDRKNDTSVSLFLIELYQATRILPLLYLKPQGDQKVANLLKMVDMARSLEGRGVVTLRAFVRFLKKMDAAEAEEGESPLAEESENVVRMMTIHKSKGLEFPLIILGDVAYEGSSRGRTALLNHKQGSLELRIGSQEKGLATLGWKASAENQELREEAEALRLLYVAVTRARDYFVLPLGPTDSKQRFLTPLWQDLNLGENPPWGEAIQCQSGSSITVFDSRKLETEKKELRPFRSTVDVKKPRQHSISKKEETEASLNAYRAWEERCRNLLKRGSACRRIIPAGAVLKREEGGDSHVHGRGPLFGSFVHELFRTIDFRNPLALRTIAKTLGRRYELDQATIHRGIALVEWGLNSPVLVRAARSSSCWKEVPFVYRYRDDLLEGFVDLVFEEDGQLVVVDFKTDAVKTEKQLEEKLQRYTPQGVAYAMALSAITSRTVKEAVFLFLAAKAERAIAMNKEIYRHTEKRLAESLHAEGVEPR